MGFNQSLSTAESFRVVSVFDEDVDADAMGKDVVLQYRETHDKALLRLKGLEDNPAVWFTLRSVSDDELKRIIRETSTPERAFDEIFRQACVAIEGLTVSVDGRRVPAPFKRLPSAGFDKRLSDETAQAVPGVVRVELGEFVFAQSALADEVKKKSSART